MVYFVNGKRTTISTKTANQEKAELFLKNFNPSITIKQSELVQQTKVKSNFISISDFKNPTILGHIHKASRNRNVSVLGTPYTTNFGEEGKDCFYGIVSEGNVQKIPSTRGPRHLVIDYDKVEENLDWLNSGDFNLIRVNIGTLDEGMHKIAETLQSIEAPSVEVKYKPLIDDKEDFLPDDRTVTSVMSDDLIDHYINSSNTKINKQDLLDGLKQIHENQQSRNR